MSTANDLEWYLPDDQKNDVTGPLTTAEIEALYKKGDLTPDSFIWASHFKTQRWSRIADTEELKHLLKVYPSVKIPKWAYTSAQNAEKQQSVQLNFNAEGEYGKENAYRRYPRAPLDVEVLVHNQKQLHIGHCIDISEKGASILLDQAGLFEKGEEVIITFRNVPNGVGTFSAAGAVVRIIDEKKEHKYGIFFLHVNPRIKRLIARYIVKTLGVQSQPEQEAS